jgi:hypothetical protein
MSAYWTSEINPKEKRGCAVATPVADTIASLYDHLPYIKIYNVSKVILSKRSLKKS